MGELTTKHGRLTPIPRDEFPLPMAPMGISIFARARYWSEQRQAEAYTQLVVAKNTLLRVLEEQYELLERREQLRERAEMLPELREIERYKIRNELAGMRGQAELGALRFQAEKSELEITVALNRKRLAEIQSSAPAAKAPTTGEKIAAAVVEITTLNAEIEAQKDKIIERAGGLEKLSESERRLLASLDEIRSITIPQLFEGIAS